MKIETGMIIEVNYNGKKYNGVVENIRSVGNRNLVTLAVKDDDKYHGIGYRSLYLDKMTNIHEVGYASSFAK